MILVAGGTGRLGRLVAAGLSDQGHLVRVLARRMPPRGETPPGVAVVTADVRDLRAVRRAAEGTSCVVSAIHGMEDPSRDGLREVDDMGTANLVTVATAVGADLVLMSVVGAAPDARPELFRAKWAAEERVRASGRPWTVVRSTAFLQTQVAMLARTARGGRVTVVGPGTVPMWPVDVRDVAQILVRVVIDTSMRGRVIEVSGPERLTQTQLAEQLASARGWTLAPRHLPLRLARAAAAVAGPLRPELARGLRLAVDTAGRPLVPDPALAPPGWAPRPLDVAGHPEDSPA